MLRQGIRPRIWVLIVLLSSLAAGVRAVVEMSTPMPWFELSVMRMISGKTKAADIFHVAAFDLALPKGELIRFSGEIERLSINDVSSVSEFGDFGVVECGESGKTGTRFRLLNPSRAHVPRQAAGFLLPTVKPHNESVIASFINQKIKPRKDHLRIVALTHDAKQAVGACHLVLLQPHLQAKWPAIRLSVGSPMSEAPPSSIPHQPLPLQTTLVDRRVHRFTVFDLKHPVIQTLNHEASNITAIPATVCMTAAKRKQIAQAFAKEQGGQVITSMLQMKASTKILDVAMQAVLSPLFDATFSSVTKGVEHTATHEICDRCNQAVPPQVIELTQDPLKLNISNLITDVSAYRLNDILVRAFVNTLGPILVDQIALYVIPQLHKDLEPVLKESVGDDLIKTLPQILKRSLKLVLVPRLTRAMTHSLVPSLTAAMGHLTNPHENEECIKCNTEGKYCSLCKSSPESHYYGIYHAAYYADYFSEYYQQYYTASVVNIDKWANPNAKYSSPAERSSAGTSAAAGAKGAISGAASMLGNMF